MSERRTASALAYLHPDFSFIMDDDSMESAGIRAGDIVAFTACDHAEDSQIVAVQTDSAVLLLRLICNGALLADAPRTRQEHVIRFDELPGADINREKAKAGQQTDKEVQSLRESCITLLELLDDPEAVRGILLHASRLYCEQERRKPQEGQQ